MAKLKFSWFRGRKDDSAETKYGSLNTLADRIAAGPLSPAEALHYAIVLAEALRKVHNRGRVFGTLRPSSVTIHDDELKLPRHSPAALSPYSSPEQVGGRDLDTRTDIFALGAVIYEMFSGRRPFDAPTRTALRTVILDEQPLPLQNAPTVVVRLVSRCLEKKRERRIQHIEVLLAELKLLEIMERARTPKAPQ